MRNWTRLPTLVILLALTAAGCGETRTRTHAPTGTVTPTVAYEVPECPDTATPGLDERGSPEARSPLPDDFAPVWVLRCRTETRAVPDAGVVILRIAERADTPATELVARLREPSDPRTAGACHLNLVLPPYFVLVDAAGRALRPSVPTDPCGQPRAAATAPLDAMDFRLLSEERIGQAQSQLSTETGCPDSWKDQLTIQAGEAAPAPARPIWSDPVMRLRVCVYASAAADALAGALLSGRAVDGDAARTLAEKLDRAGAATACTAGHTRFAVVSNPADAAWAVVELDGCRRLLRPDGTLGQLDESMVAALVG